MAPGRSRLWLSTVANQARTCWSFRAGERSHAPQRLHPEPLAVKRTAEVQRMIPGRQTAERCLPWMTKPACLGQAVLSFGSGQLAVVFHLTDLWFSHICCFSSQPACGSGNDQPLPTWISTSQRRLWLLACTS